VAIATDRETLEKLIAKAERRIDKAWRESIRWLRQRWSEKRLAKAYSTGDLSELNSDLDRMAAMFATSTTAIVVLASKEIANGVISRAIGSPFEIDQHAEQMVEMLRRDRLRMVSEITQEQRAAWTQSIARGVQMGSNPLTIARDIRNSMGLTAKQDQIVANYRRALEQRDATAALDRALRDRRFDRTVERAARGEVALTPKQIDRMVERYHERWVKYRSEVIARTESLRVAHMGADEAYRQAVEQGDLDESEIERTWLHTNRGPNSRDFHEDMNGQKRKLGALFVSGNGNLLRYPGDLAAPASETIQCRCVLVTRLNAVRV
jgi:hypothetical protein